MTPLKVKLSKTIQDGKSREDKYQHFINNGPATKIQPGIKPKEFIKKARLTDQPFNNCIEAKLQRQITKMACQQNYDVYLLGDMFGLPSEISQGPPPGMKVEITTTPSVKEKGRSNRRRVS